MRTSSLKMGGGRGKPGQESPPAFSHDVENASTREGAGSRQAPSCQGLKPLARIASPWRAKFWPGGPCRVARGFNPWRAALPQPLQQPPPPPPGRITCQKATSHPPPGSFRCRKDGFRGSFVVVKPPVRNFRPALPRREGGLRC